jgi:hypothetical protein
MGYSSLREEKKMKNYEELNRMMQMRLEEILQAMAREKKAEKQWKNRLVGRNPRARYLK